MMEEQIANTNQIVTTQNNDNGYYTNVIGIKPEYWPINPGYANGFVASNLGIFKYELELLNYDGQFDGSSGNYAKFEIEAQ